MKGFFGFMHRFHRIIGLIAIVPVIFLLVTGLLLEFREGLSLHEKYPENTVILWLYGGEGRGLGNDANVGELYLDYSEEPASYERILTAFHAGRFRGKDTRALLVFSAFTLLTLSLTGPYLWCRRFLFKGRNSGSVYVNEKLMESTLQLSMIRSAAKGLYSRANRLHDLSEHVMEHIKGSSGAGLEKDMGRIEGHMKELDAKMHSILERIERLGVKSKKN